MIRTRRKRNSIIFQVERRTSEARITWKTDTTSSGFPIEPNSDNIEEFLSRVINVFVAHNITADWVINYPKRMGKLRLYHWGDENSFIKHIAIEAVADLEFDYTEDYEVSISGVRYRKGKILSDPEKSYRVPLGLSRLVLKKYFHDVDDPESLINAIAADQYARIENMLRKDLKAFILSSKIFEVTNPKSVRYIEDALDIFFDDATTWESLKRFINIEEYIRLLEA